MKCSELQIGDWVLNDGEYIQVTDIYKYGKRYYINDDDTYVRYVEPIPLTVEILERNGFSEDYRYENLSYIQSCGAVTGIHINGKNGLMDEMYFKYVNELQNALRLCGLNELADNFKVEE